MAKDQKFSDMLKQWRMAHNWLQKQAADALNVSIDTYRQWEQGQMEPHDTPSKTEILVRMEAMKP